MTRPERPAEEGGYYELALDLGPTSDERLQGALRRIWSFNGVRGCADDPQKAWNQAWSINPQTQELPPMDQHLYGLAVLPNGTEVLCSTVTVRLEDDHDWVYFGITMGELGRAYPVGAFPFDDGGPLAWRDGLDEWLRQMGEAVFKTVPFVSGLVGWEPDDALGVNGKKADAVPKVRCEGWLWPHRGMLRWYPPNHGAPFGWKDEPIALRFLRSMGLTRLLQAIRRFFKPSGCS